jgi:hypothetical protein
LHVAGLKKAMQHKLFKDPQKITEEGMTWWLNPHEEDKPWKAHKQARFTTTPKTEIERRIGAQLHAKKKKKKENPFFFRCSPFQCHHPWHATHHMKKKPINLVENRAKSFYLDLEGSWQWR